MGAFDGGTHINTPIMPPRIEDISALQFTSLSIASASDQTRCISSHLSSLPLRQLLMLPAIPETFGLKPTSLHLPIS